LPNKEGELRRQLKKRDLSKKLERLRKRELLKPLKLKRKRGRGEKLKREEDSKEKSMSRTLPCRKPNKPS
jgi:transcriptional antiterminator